MHKTVLVGLLIGSCLIYGMRNQSRSLDTGRDWPNYGGNKAGNRYSPLTQISTKNVKELQVAWMYDATEKPDPDNSGRRRNHEIQCQPIVVDGILYGTTPELKLFALKAGTGEQLWKFEPSKSDRLNSSQIYTEADITNISPAAHAYVKERFEKLKTSNKFAPPNTQGTLLFGYSGGTEWGGNAVDPNGILYQNANEAPWVLIMTERAKLAQQTAPVTAGNALYTANCATCHGQNRQGNGPDFPALVGIDKKRSMDEVKSLLKTGSGRMPSFGHLSEKDRDVLVNFLFNKDTGAASVTATMTNTPTPAKSSGFPYSPAYVSKLWDRFLDQDGYPGIKPPWGTLNAGDLNTGDYLWRVPLGEYPELAKKSIPTTGTDSYGGPLVTAGGLVFISGTKDEKFRTFDQETGKVAWEYQLPAGGFATPITYEVDGKQYVVIAAGGGRGQKSGGNYIAFSLK